MRSKIIPIKLMLPLHCGNSFKLAQYFVLNLAVRAFKRFPGRKQDDVLHKSQPGRVKYELPLLTVGVLDKAKRPN